VNSVLAKREVVSLGYDEAIMLDAAGAVAEGTGENIFMVHRDRLYTPPLSMPILDGITRDAGHHAGARETGSRWWNRPSRATCCTRPARSSSPAPPARSRRCARSDKISIGAGEPGPITRKLQAAFTAVVKGVFRDSSGVAGVSVMGFASPSARQG